MLALFLRFYRSYAAATLSVTMLCLYVYWKKGNTLLADLILFKLVTSVLIAIITNSIKEKENYYYYNLHRSKQSLWLISLSTDLLIMMMLVLFIHFITQ